MAKEVQMTFRVESELRGDFTDAAELDHRPAAQVLRELMRAYVNEARERQQRVPANDAISAAERRRREDATSFAFASVSLEGFKPSKQALAQTRRHINGEILLSELIQMKPDTEPARNR